MEAVHNNTSIASHMLHHISPNGQKVSTSKDAEKGITNIPRSMSEQASDTIYVFVFVRNFLVQSDNTINLVYNIFQNELPR
jgi:hypothetical protein